MSKIAYDLSKIQAFVFDVDGVLSPSTIPLADDGTPQRMVNIKDGLALQLAVRNGYRVAIISGARDEAITYRYKSLGIKDVYLGADKKVTLLTQWLKANRLSAEDVVYAGDDLPDIGCMKMVGLSVAPSDSAAEILETARYIAPVRGGYGIARNIIEEVMRAKGQWPDDANAFGW